MENNNNKMQTTSLDPLDVKDESFSVRLKRFSERYGKESIGSYYQQFFGHGSVPSKAFTRVLLKLIERNFPEADLQELRQNFAKEQFIFTANHGGFENHPQLTAGSLLTCMGAYLTGHSAVFLTCAALTPTHVTMPAGFMLHALRPDLKRSQLRFLSNKYNEVFINHCPFPDLSIAKKRVQALPEGALLPHELNVIEKLQLNTQAASFSDALLQHNAHSYEEALSERFPGLKCYFADIDELASLLLIEDLKEHGPFYDLLSSPKLVAELIVQMANSGQAWHSAQIGLNADPGRYTAGTVLFYCLNEKFEHSSLGCRIDDKDGKTTITLLNHKGFVLELTPDNVLQGLLQGRLHPNTFTVNVLLSLFHHCTLAGGIFFDGYIHKLIGIPAKLLSVPMPEGMLERRVQSVMLPFKCLNEQARGSFDEARPLLHIDLLAKKRFSSAELDAVLSAPLCSALPLSLSEVYFGVELTPQEAAARHDEMLQLLRADSPCVLRFD